MWLCAELVYMSLWVTGPSATQMTLFAIILFWIVAKQTEQNPLLMEMNI